MKNPAIRAHAKQVVAQNWGKMIRMSLLISVMSLLAIVGFLLAPAASFIYISGLSVGYTAALLNMCDGKTVKVTDVFSQLRRGVSSFGLVLWMGLKIFFWMLPGLAVVLVGTAISVMADSSNMMYFFMFVSYVIMMVCVVCVVRASYSYAMAPYFHADNSAMSAFDALNASKELMNGRRFQLFKLTIPYILILLAIMIGYTVILALCQQIEWLMILVGIVGYIAIMIVSVWISLLSSMAQACFYKMCDQVAE